MCHLCPIQTIQQPNADQGRLILHFAAFWYLLTTHIIIIIIIIHAPAGAFLYFICTTSFS
jgi:hypothetical protein